MSLEVIKNQFEPPKDAFINSRGVGTIVMNANHEILIGTEFLAKRDHERHVGALSIPLETFKPFERNNPNAVRLAALSEITTPNNIDRLKMYLKEAALQGPVKLGEGGIEGALAVFHWTGDPEEMPFEPAVPGEFGNLQWMEPGVAITLPNLRPYADVMIRYADDKGLLNGLSNRPVPLLNKWNVARYTAIREDKNDVGGNT